MLNNFDLPYNSFSQNNDPRVDFIKTASADLRSCWQTLDVSTTFQVVMICFRGLSIQGNLDASSWVTWPTITLTIYNKQFFLTEVQRRSQENAQLFLGISPGTIPGHLGKRVEWAHLLLWSSAHHLQYLESRTKPWLEYQHLLQVAAPTHPYQLGHWSHHLMLMCNCWMDYVQHYEKEIKMVLTNT